jgi:SAM-dependent methyltransferase
MLKALGQKLDDGRWFTPSADRNKGPILAVLQRVLPRTGLVLEIASGTGQHVAHFAKALPGLDWQPSDAEPAFRDSIRAWIALEKLANARPPVDLDVCSLPWPVARADALLCINMLHVAPWAATQALFRGAGEVLADGGVVFLYGPYRRFGRHTAASNEAFDAQLKASDPAWGLRDLEAVVDLAGQAGLGLADVVDMPANNLSVVLRREPNAMAV